MTPPDSVEQKLQELTRRTAEIGAPAGFEARTLARLALVEAREQQRFWRVGQGAVGLAFCTAIASLVLAVWHDERLTDEVSRSPDAGAELESRDP
jgi:hypothetical protein